MKAQRNLEAISTFLIYVKAGYFLSLIDATAPLIDNITVVISDIKYFAFVLGIQIIAFASCFYIIGQNQLDFDNIGELDPKTASKGYWNFSSSIWYVYTTFVLSGKRYSDFTLGDKS